MGLLKKCFYIILSIILIPVVVLAPYLAPFILLGIFIYAALTIDPKDVKKALGQDEDQDRS